MPDPLKAWIHELPDALITCRDLGHTWRPYRAGTTDNGTYSRTLRCNRCRTERSQELTRNGHTLSNRYDYPEGYRTPAGVGHLDPDGRDMLRLDSLLRLIERQR